MRQIDFAYDAGIHVTERMSRFESWSKIRRIFGYNGYRVGADDLEGEWMNCETN